MSDSLRWRLCTYTLVLAQGMSALGAGGVHLPLLAASAALLIASAALTVPQLDGEARVRSWRERLGIGMGLGLTAYCLLQALPLPLSWLGLLAPQNAEIWTRSFKLLEGPVPAFASLSLAPGRTVIEALKVASQTAAFASALALSAKLGLQRIAAIAFGLALGVAVVTAAHQVVGAERLYGIYQPIDAYSIAPLLNANNRAGYLNLGFFCGLGLLFRAGARPYAALIGIGLAFVAAEVLLCESLGGTGALILGLIAVLLLPRGRGSRHPSEPARWLQAGIVVALAGFAALMALAARRSPLGLDDRSVEKLDLFARAAKLAADHPWFGVGRGAFGSVFAAYQPPGGHFISEHVENFPLQWAAEWGFPVALAALLALASLFVPLLRLKVLRSPTRRCALVGLAVLLVQNLVDLGLEIPAVAALFWCVLGGALAEKQDEARRSVDEVDSRRLAWLGWAVPAVSALCLILAVAFGVSAPARLRHELRADLAATPGAPTTEFWSELRSAIRAFPGDAYFPLLGSSAALAAAKNPLPWISRALERFPASAESHVQLARILMAHQRQSQALGALRRAVELDARRASSVLQLAEQWRLTPEQAAEAAPEGRAGARLLFLLASRASDSATRQRLLERSLERDDAQPDTHYQLAHELWWDVTRKSSDGPCATKRDACLERAAHHAARAEVPTSPRAGILQSRLLVEQGRHQEAEQQLAKLCDRFPGDTSCGEALVAVAITNASPRLEEAVRALVAAACKNRESCSEAHMQLGQRFARANDWGVALGHYRRASEENPSTRTFTALATAAERLGQETLVRDARRRLELLRMSEAPSPRGKPVSTPSKADDVPAVDEGPSTIER